MSHEAICPCNLQCNLCRNKYRRLQLGCQTYATCFATCNEIIFSARRVFKNVCGILIMLTSCSGVSHAATCRVALRKVEAASTFSATCNAIFRCETTCKHGVSHEEVFLATCNATPLRCKLQGKLPRVTWHGFTLSANARTCRGGANGLSDCLLLYTVEALLATTLVSD